jgi:hypothetical protein
MMVAGVCGAALLGALTTVSVAWWLAWRVNIGNPNEWTDEDQSPGTGTWSVRRWEPPPIISGNLPAPDPYPPVVRLFLGLVARNDHTQGDHVAFDTLTFVARARVRAAKSEWERALGASAASGAQARTPAPFMWDARGWPRPALSCEWRWAAGADLRATQPTLEGGFALAPDTKAYWPFQFRALPVVPVWSGFWYDTAVFGLAWGAILVGPGAVRRLIRRGRVARGLCPRCCYSRLGLAAGAPCPECGGL